ncbi:hypothetical protein [Paenibacillus sp. CFBP 13594]|uniref:hypothetical protein n=1 Tax=Paenibacillus sp. CFBP 13594 TaxID=2774037 RepID=UPI00406CF769
MQHGIRQAGLPDCNEVGQLFNEYRMFYNQNADIEAAHQYIRERMERHESVILVAETDAESDHGTDESNGMSLSNGFICTGFVQLYPSFSSVSMGPVWVLNDLYVHPIVSKALPGSSCKQPNNWHLSEEFFVYHSQPS